MERESGYYWVNYQGEWGVALWYKESKDSNGCWLTAGNEATIDFDSLFEEIDERRIVREETKQIERILPKFENPPPPPTEQFVA